MIHDETPASYAPVVETANAMGEIDNEAEARSCTPIEAIQRYNVRSLPSQHDTRTPAEIIQFEIETPVHGWFVASFRCPHNMAEHLAHNGVRISTGIVYDLEPYPNENRITCSFQHSGEEPELVAELIRQVLIHRMADPLIQANALQAGIHNVLSRLGRQATHVCQTGSCSIM